MDYKRKIDFAIKLLRSIPQYGPIEVSYSGGKDSDVILELTKMSGIPYRAIYKNTTIDPPGTIAHCKENGVEIMKPKMTFFELVRKNGIPSRFFRFCCSYLKEYKVLDRSIQGIRRSESTARANRYKEPEVCRVYSAKEKVRQYLPILDWTDEDVFRFIDERGIKCHPLYYDRGGQLNVKKRLGCIGCPLASQKKIIEQFMEYPGMLRAWIKNAQIYLDTHTHVKTYQNISGNAHYWMYSRLFCEISAESRDNALSGGLFPEMEIDPKKFLEEYFKIDLTI